MAKVVQKKPYFGLQFVELTKSQPDVHTSFTWSRDKKAYLHGTLTLDRHKGSWKYPNEVVLTVWGHTTRSGTLKLYCLECYEELWH